MAKLIQAATTQTPYMLYRQRDTGTIPAKPAGALKDSAKKKRVSHLSVGYFLSWWRFYLLSLIPFPLPHSSCITFLASIRGWTRWGINSPHLWPPDFYVAIMRLWFPKPHDISSWDQMKVGLRRGGNDEDISKEHHGRDQKKRLCWMRAQQSVRRTNAREPRSRRIYQYLLNLLRKIYDSASCTNLIVRRNGYRWVYRDTTAP